MSGISSSTTSANLLTPKVITNSCSPGAVSIAAISTINNYKKTLSGSLTLNVLASNITVTGPGVLSVCYLKGEDATARTLRLQVILDGVTVFDATTGAIADANTINLAAGVIGAKGNDATYPVHPAVGMPFSTSMTINIASSISENNKLATWVYYWTC